MLSVFAKTTLVLTSLAPVLVTYGLSRLPGEWKLAIALFITAAILVASCLVLLRFAKTKLQVHQVTLVSVKNADQEILAFILTYLLPLVTAGDQNVNIPVASFVFVLIFIAIFNSNSYHFNPLLGVFGYHFYEITTTDNITLVLLTRKRIRGIGQSRQIVEISDYLIMEAN